MCAKSIPKENLRQEDRLRLAEAIINYDFNGDVQHTITPTRFIQIRTEIEKEFPDESGDAWYIPYSKESKRGPLGCLYDKYCSLNRLLVKNGLRTSQRGPKTDKTLKEFEVTEEIQEVLHWLQNRIQPWIFVSGKWTLTCEVRHNTLKSAVSDHIADYFEQYKVLKQPLGYTLLEQDFDQLYPQLASIFPAKWPDFAIKLRQKVKNTDKTSNSDVAALSFLPKLFNAFNISTRGNQPHRVNSQEVLNNFILLVKTADDIDPGIERIENAARRIKQSV